MPISYDPPPLHRPRLDAQPAKAPAPGRAGDAARLILFLLVVLAMLAAGAAAGFLLTPNAQALLERARGKLSADGWREARVSGGVLKAPAARLIRAGEGKYALRLPLPAADGEEADHLLIFPRAADPSTPSIRQRAAIYRHYMAGKPRRAGAGLAEYRFRAASPYADMTLYMGRKAGRVIFILCRDRPLPLRAAECSSSFSLSPGLVVAYAFPRRRLNQWANIDALAHQAMAQYFTPR